MLHLIGFAKEWDISSHTVSARVADIAGNGSRIAGIWWLAAGILFMSAALMFLFRRDGFWIPAAIALVLSQVLVITYWNEAKYATIINLLVLVIVIISAAAMYFNRAAARDVDTLLSDSRQKEIIVTRQAIDSLPLNVQRWLVRSGVVDGKTTNIIRVTQKGELRTSPGGAWMPFQATEHFSIDPPAFVWTAKIKAASLLTIAGRDRLRGGHGHMLIKPLYLFTGANSSGKEMDQGTLLRYLAESMWFPQAATSDYITWESVSVDRARATITYGDVTASGIFTFDSQGRVIAFEAKRYGEFDGVFRKEIWSVETKEFADFNGMTIGHKNEITWKLPEGDFQWLRMEVTNISPVN